MTPFALRRLDKTSRMPLKEVISGNSLAICTPNTAQAVRKSGSTFTRAPTIGLN